MFALLLSITVSMVAQVTTSALSGQVRADGSPIIGATIKAIHEPSGSKYLAVTNEKGRYSIQGMRVGGPYKVEISFIGYEEKNFSGIYLQLGDPSIINADLKEDNALLGEVIVKGQGKTNAGASSNFGKGKIENTPSVSRNIYDVAKLSPLVSESKRGGITIAGTNNRYNSFQIDGTVSNDVFGLASTGTNGGQTGANPISVDAIQELQVVVAPFDVRQSGFTGGAINAVTKSGTNKFHGSAYTYYTNQDMWGKYAWSKDHMKQEMEQQSTKTYGATIGGPIIKDKLFFFASVEKKEKTYPSSIYPGYSSNYISEATAKQIGDKYTEFTGFAEDFGKQNINTKSLGVLARIDWNINDNNKFSVRYQMNNSSDDKNGLGSRKFTFNNSGYTMKNKTNSFVAELNSKISESLFNEARVSGSFVRDHRDVPYQGPTVQIKNVLASDGKTNMEVNLGTDYSSGANYLNQNIWTIEDNLSWYIADHTLTFGTHNEIYNMKNCFIQASNGAWYYDSLDDFMNDNPWKFQYKYSDPEVTNGNLKYAPSIKAGTFGLYAQDKWNILDNLTLTYGMRFDLTTTFNEPSTNAKFNEFAAGKGLNAEVGNMPGAKLLVSPRLGFRWYADKQHKTLFRGGVGIFTGRVPFVWLSNAYTNTGIEQKGTTYQPKGDDVIPALGKYHDNPMGAANLGGYGQKPDIVVVDNDFKYPQVLRANFAWEQRLPYDFKFTLEGIYSKNLNNVFFENLALEENGKTYAVPGVENSSAINYSNERSDYYSIINLRNTNKGYSYNLSAKLEKSFDFGLDLMASYTFGRSRSVNDGTSSVAFSNWKYNYSRNTNDRNEMGFSKFDIPHRVMVQVSYASPKYWHNWMSTNVSVMYNGFSGGRYSLTMNERADFNGDGWRGNSLLYIPTKEELAKMNFVDTKYMKAEDSRKAFEEWIEQDDYAKDHRGKYAQRNSNMSKWENEVNLHIGQMIYNSKGQGKFEITFDIINFANMLNKKWGAHYGNINNLSPLTLEGVDKETHAAKFSYNSGNKAIANDIFSRWNAQIGFKLLF